MDAAQIEKMKALALAAQENDFANGTSLTNEFLAFMDEANPASVLELIAEVERLRADAERYQWISARTEREGRDGGWTGYFRLPYVDGWDDTPYSAKRGEGYHHKTLDEAIDAKRGAHTQAGKPA